MFIGSTVHTYDGLVDALPADTQISVVSDFIIPIATQQHEHT